MKSVNIQLQNEEKRKAREQPTSSNSFFLFFFPLISTKKFYVICPFYFVTIYPKKLNKGLLLLFFPFLTLKDINCSFSSSHIRQSREIAIFKLTSCSTYPH